MDRFFEAIAPSACNPVGWSPAPLTRATGPDTRDRIQGQVVSACVS